MIKELLLLIAVLLLQGCVNLHVHFPEATGKAAEPAPAEEAAGTKK
jgi:hypothetical protein